MVDPTPMDAEFVELARQVWNCGDDEADRDEDIAALWAYHQRKVAGVRGATIRECVGVVRNDALDVPLTAGEMREWGEYSLGERDEHHRTLGYLRALLPTEGGTDG